MTIGIYKIRHRISGRVYIGQSIDIERRFKQHRRELNRLAHRCSYLQNAWCKHGPDAFEFEIIVACQSSELTLFEQTYMNMHVTLYNTNPAAESARGRRMSEATKGLLAISARGRRHSAHTKKIMSDARLGVRKTEVHRQHISLALRGKTRKPLSQAHKEAVYSAMAPRSRPVIDQNGVGYRSVGHAASVHGVDRSSIRQAIRYGRPMQGLRFYYREPANGEK